VNSEIDYNDDLGSYLLIFVCVNGPTSSKTGAWYYSTATSLDLQDWTTPQMIQNSQFTVTAPCPGQAGGRQFDGWYSSTVSPGVPAGHTKLTGYFFFMNGCDTGPRQFASRTFTIAPAPNFFQGQVSLGSGAYYLQFPNDNLFGYYNYPSSSISFTTTWASRPSFPVQPLTFTCTTLQPPTGSTPARRCFLTSTTSR
jgi:hypothetical protein